MNTLDLASKKVELKKVASTHGGEWTGPCPECGGKDRFHVWPYTNCEKGSYWCRGCGKAGDNIQFLIDFEGMNFKDACAWLNINLDTNYHSKPAPTEKKEFTPTEHQSPAQLWQEKAGKFVSWAQEQLKNNQQQLDWLAARGINQGAAVAARLGWNPGENGKDLFRARTAWGLPELKKEDGRPRMLWLPRGLVIPYCVDGIIQRIRIRQPEGEPRYYVIPGSSMATMIIGIECRAFVIVESELDAIACAASTDLAGAVALGTLQGKPDAAAYEILKSSVQILNALDYGDQGGGKTAAERAFKWWADNFPDKCDRWPVPQGKDPGEAYAQGTDLGEWIKKGLPPVVTLTKSKRSDARSVSGTIPERSERDNAQATRDHAPSSVIPVVDALQGTQAGIQANQPPESAPALLKELWKLLRENPGVKIINTPTRYTVLKNDRYVGGRINELVMKPGEVNDYLLNHQDEEITWKNLFQ
jgi:DNA primase